MQFQRTILCGAAFFICASLAVGQRADIPKGIIKVQIQLDKNKFRPGEEILFRVIISNNGNQPFLIPNQMLFYTTGHSTVEFTLKDQRGKIVAPTHGWAEDCFDYKSIKLNYFNILSDYLLLPPGNSYVQQTSLGGMYNGLKPGTYHLKSNYYASFSPLDCHQWAAEDVEKFPFQVWFGTTPVNDISFTILPHSKKR